VRIALALKGLDYVYRPVHLLKGEQLQESYAAVSAARLVPLLKDEDRVLTQSLAIIEYLDETHPEPPLLPADPAGRARVRALALDIACEIHPLINLRALNYLVKDLGLDEAAKLRWLRHWIESGLAVVEQRLVQDGATGRFCHGDRPGLADCVLIPQIFSAQRFECRLDHVPTVMRIYETCMAEEAFSGSQPSACPDAF
jgi:maleylacetoacetate isomerase/maleylpyruvate isomerase